MRGHEEGVEEINQTINGHAVIEILYKEQNVSSDGLGAAEGTKCIVDGKERIPGLQLIVNADREK